MTSSDTLPSHVDDSDYKSVLEYVLLNPLNAAFFTTHVQNISCLHCCHDFVGYPKSLPYDVVQGEKLADDNSVKLGYRLAAACKKYNSLNSEYEKQKWLNSSEGKKYSQYVLMRLEYIHNRRLHINSLTLTDQQLMIPSIADNKHADFVNNSLGDLHHIYRWKFKHVFCSWNCVVAYVLETNYHAKHPDVMSMIKMVAKIIDKIPLIAHINPSGPRTLLQKFGGPLTIQEFRLKFCVIHLSQQHNISLEIIRFQSENIKIDVVPDNTHVAVIPISKVSGNPLKLPTRLKQTELPVIQDAFTKLQQQHTNKKRLIDYHENNDNKLNVNSSAPVLPHSSNQTYASNNHQAIKRKFGIDINGIVPSQNKAPLFLPSSVKRPSPFNILKEENKNIQPVSNSEAKLLMETNNRLGVNKYEKVNDLKSKGISNINQVEAIIDKLENQAKKKIKIV